MKNLNNILKFKLNQFKKIKKNQLNIINELNIILKIK